MKLRDFLAVPFWGVAQVLDWVAVLIGGKWTAKLMIDTIKKQAKVLDKLD